MEGYLGEFNIEIEDSPFRGFTKSDWILYYIECYGQIDGEQHKLWVLDQIARLQKGTIPIVKIAKWVNGQSEFRVTLGEPNQAYHEWVLKMKIGENDDCHDYDIGVAP